MRVIWIQKVCVSFIQYPNLIMETSAEEIQRQYAKGMEKDCVKLQYWQVVKIISQ